MHLLSVVLLQDKNQAGSIVNTAVGTVDADANKDTAAISNSQAAPSGPQPESPAAPSGQQPAAPDDMQLEYKGAAAPICELNRIKHLHDLNILYTPPEQRFDDITRLCTLVFKVGVDVATDKLCPWLVWQFFAHLLVRSVGLLCTPSETLCACDAYDPTHIGHPPPRPRLPGRDL